MSNIAHASPGHLAHDNLHLQRYDCFNEKGESRMSKTKRILLPLGAGLIGVLFLAGLYFGIMSWAEGFQAARDLFWTDRGIVIPIHPARTFASTIHWQGCPVMLSPAVT